MSWLLTAIVASFTAGQKIKEVKKPVIPASYWRNQELMTADKLNLTPEQVQRNLENGKYFLSDTEYECRQQSARPDYSYHKGENINSWMERLSREQQERMDKLYGRK